MVTLLCGPNERYFFGFFLFPPPIIYLTALVSVGLEAFQDIFLTS